MHYVMLFNVFNDLRVRVRVTMLNTTYFSYIVVVSFIGGGNQSTRRKPPTCCKS
jgi:hypothetical protein